MLVAVTKANVLKMESLGKGEFVDRSHNLV